MRLVSYKTEAAEDEWRPGIAIDGEVVDVASLRPAGGASPAPASVREILQLSDAERAGLLEAAAALQASRTSLAKVILGPPVPDPQKILCVGLNYRDHAEEAHMDLPPVPMFFAKFPNSLIGPGAPIVAPAETQKLDYEGELAVVIGRRCKRVPRADALTVVGGYMPFNDISARDLQLQTPQWTAGKAPDSFGPCGPALVTADEVLDPQALRLVTRVNGEMVQDSNTSGMIFGIAETIAFISSLITLEVGDIIATGTPAGVGAMRVPPLWLADGDEVEVEVEGLGTIRNPVAHEVLAEGLVGA